MNIIKQWILNRKFVIDSFNVAKEEYFKTKVPTIFKDAQTDILETMQDDIDKKADELADIKLEKLLTNIDVRKIVSFDKTRGVIYIGGERVEEGRLNNLKAEAEFFMQSDLWHLIYETPKELASRSMFVSGETLADLNKGRSILYTLSTQNNIVQILKGYVAKPKPPTPPMATP